MPPHGRGLFAETPHDVPQNQMGKWRDRTEALHAGNRTRTAKAFATDGTPSLLVEDNRSTSAHQKLGWPNGFAPIPTPSRGAVLLLHHDHHLKWSPWSD